MCISGLNGHVTFTVAAGRFMVEKTRKPEAPFYLVYEVYEIIGRTLRKKKKEEYHQRTCFIRKQFTKGSLNSSHAGSLARAPQPKPVA